MPIVPPGLHDTQIVKPGLQIRDSDVPLLLTNLPQHLISSHGDRAFDDEALQAYRRTRPQAPHTRPQSSKASQLSTSTSPAAVKSGEVRELCCPNCKVTFASAFQLNCHLTMHKWCPFCPTSNCGNQLELKQVPLIHIVTNLEISCLL